MNQLEARERHSQDQAWASLREFKSDIERIALGGLTSSELDAAIVRKVFLVMSGDMCFRESETKGPNRKD